MKTASVETYTIRLYIGGDFASAKQYLRREFYPPNKGQCVTVEPTTFIYTGGEEEGVVIGFVNYPRFPCSPDELWGRATSIATGLMNYLCQMSCLLVGPDKSTWLSLRPEDNK